MSERLPEIVVRKRHDGLFHASIHHGVGHHGIGETIAEALKYAAESWYWHEVKEADKASRP
jgi:hypothetical protein